MDRDDLELIMAWTVAFGIGTLAVVWVAYMVELFSLITGYGS